MAKSKKATLLYGDTQANADMFYVGRIDIPDPVFAFTFARKSVVIVSSLEYTRVKKNSAFTDVLLVDDLKEKYKSGKNIKSYLDLLCHLLKNVANEYGINEFTVGIDFPLGFAQRLKSLKLKLTVTEDTLYPKREQKTSEELKYLKIANRASAAGIRAAEKALKESKIVKNRLIYKGKALTSQSLRSIIDTACLELGSYANNTIVAGGDQACDPHCIGDGLLRPNELIIVDVFPRCVANGYHGDMTRTFLKGKASEAQKQLVKTVKEGQARALKKIKAGASGRKVYQETANYFEQNGYETQKKGDIYEGFFHSLGHGLGLEVHEPPRIGAVDQKLKSGHVITVEPGLYYPGLGGCRIEDVVCVTQNGYEKLSSYHYSWQIK